MNKWTTVARFTFMNKIKARSFLVTTLIIAAVLSLLINLPHIISLFSSGGGPTKIGVLGDGSDIPQKLQAYYEAQEEPKLKIVLLDNQGSKEANEAMMLEKIEAKEVKGVLELTSDPAAGFPKVIYKSKDSMNSSLPSEIRTVLQSIKSEMVVKEIGLSSAQLAKLTAPVSLDYLQLQQGSNGKSESEIAVAYMLVYVLLMLLYVGVLGFGNMVAMEITAEKSSRVMELLITSVSPLKQMFGKIVGICLLGLLQMVVFIGVGLANLAIPANRDKLKDFDLSLSGIDPMLIVYFILFYLLGYFIYSTLFAAVGSLVSRTEDIGQAIMPLTMLIVAGFMIAIFGLQNPNGSFVVAMSFVPFFTPLIMFLRIGMSDPALWEIWLAIGLTVVSIYLLSWLSAKIYRVGVLMYGKKPSFAEIRRAMKAFKV
ncbi:ABC transporter permease [Paenibacillus koleovorans]|uniref:ABC transporter permease n=1 Tax=Paenibacillus koleovorans TaxID=121608 RepID=UPI000FD8A654|nr:ABC transporter permease [Paenibacillus koleovorans]